MAPPPVTIAGWSSTAKVPGVVADVVYGAGPINAAAIPLICLLVGLQTSAGIATAGSDIKPVTNSDDASTFYGPTSELANMCYKALAIPGINLYAAGLAESSGVGVAAATLTITITLSSGTNPAAQGTLQYWIGGRYISVSFSTTDTVTTIATSIVNAINANPRWPFTATSAAGVVTVTVGNKGLRGNDYIAFADTTKANGTNVVTTFTGGTTVTGGGIHFTAGVNGATAENVSGLLSVLFPGTWDFIGTPHYDVTNAALWLTHSQQKAGPLEMRPCRVVYGYQGTLTNATTLAQTTLNDQRSRVFWLLNSEIVPSEMAAVFAALECQARQADPGAGTVFLNTNVPGLLPQRAQADRAQRATQESALANGVTPLVTVGSGIQIVRLIGTHSLNGTTPDYRTLDGADDYVPDFIRKDLSLYWATEFVVSNPRVADDPDPTQRARPAGVATPTVWNNIVTGRLLGYELRGPIGPLPIVVNTTLHPPTSGYDPFAKRIMTLVPVEVMPGNYQAGLSIRQIVPT